MKARLRAHEGRQARTARKGALCVAAALGLSTLSTSANTYAQAWAVDRVEPAPAGDLFFQTHFPVFATDRFATLFFGLSNAYSYQPLVAVLDTGLGTQTVGAIDHLFATHAQINVHLAGRLGLDVSLPVYWVQSGTSDPDVHVRAMSGVNVGDLRLGVRIRIVGRAQRDPASLHLAATGRLGFLDTTDNAPQTTSDGALRGRIFAVGAGTLGIFRWSVSTGVQLRPGVDAANVHVGSEIFALAGAGVSLAANRLFVGAEGEFATSLMAPLEAGTNHVQLWAEARVSLLDDAVRVGIGAGPGLSQAPGTPAFGAFLTLAYALPVGDSAPAVVSEPTREMAAAPATTAHAATQSSTSTATVIESTAQRATPQHDATASSSRAPTPPSSPPTTTDDATSPSSSPSTAPSPRPPDDTFCSVPSAAACATSDVDGDGILEPLDQCPTVRPGPHPHPARPGCPDSDTDGDGVYDAFDQCPRAAQGTAPDPDRRGCPLPDADGDHIPDAVDHCPSIPGAPHPDPTLNGCPGLVRLESNSVEILQPILFAPNRAVIQRRSTAVMQAVANALAARREIRYMLIEGHTDDVGNAELNVDLSQRRAAAVLRWLVDHGISPARLQSRGMGSLVPRVPVRPGMPRRALRDARLRNRRVEFEILEDPHVAPSGVSGSGSASAAPRGAR